MEGILATVIRQSLLQLFIRKFLRFLALEVLISVNNVDVTILTPGNLFIRIAHTGKVGVPVIPLPFPHAWYIDCFAGTLTCTVCTMQIKAKGFVYGNQIQITRVSIFIRRIFLRFLALDVLISVDSIDITTNLFSFKNQFWKFPHTFHHLTRPVCVEINYALQSQRGRCRNRKFRNIGEKNQSPMMKSGCPKPPPDPSMPMKQPWLPSWKHL